MSAPQTLFGKETLSEGPSIQFGFGRYFVAKAATEIETNFGKPSRLADVRMRPLGVALRSWHRRMRKAKNAAKPSPFGARKWDGEVIIPISFDFYLDGPTAWVFREGDVGLSWWERQLVKRSFRFARAAKELSDPLTPDSFIEELTDKLVGQIEKSALSGFKTSLAELVSYHSFILSTQDTIDSTGAPLNLAQVGAGLFERPDQRWVHLYRRVHFVAVNKIASEATFVDTLGHVARRLIPADARKTRRPPSSRRFSTSGSTKSLLWRIGSRGTQSSRLSMVQRRSNAWLSRARIVEPTSGSSSTLLVMEPSYRRPRSSTNGASPRVWDA